jgi:lactam utilization protein B
VTELFFVQIDFLSLARRSGVDIGAHPSLQGIGGFDEYLRKSIKKFLKMPQLQPILA